MEERLRESLFCILQKTQRLQQILENINKIQTLPDISHNVEKEIWYSRKRKKEVKRQPRRETAIAEAHEENFKLHRADAGKGSLASLASSYEIKIFRTDRHSGGEKQCEIYNLAEQGTFGCLTVNSMDVPGAFSAQQCLRMFADYISRLLAYITRQ